MTSDQFANRPLRFASGGTYPKGLFVRMEMAMTTADKHLPVLLDEAVTALAIRPGGCYLDGTYGRGGHTARILEALGSNGRLLALDRDPTAVAAARERWSGDDRFTIWHGNFADVDHAAQETGVAGFDGMLLDLGVSSPQLDDETRGFSFQGNGPLDMRMDTSQGVTAADWIETVSPGELERVLRDYGEERFARRIVRAIVDGRVEAPIDTTGRLAAIVAAAVPGREIGKHPATRTFQAIRIAINDELGAIEQALDRCLGLLNPGGRLVVISFHSLEDRIVKRFIRQHSMRPAGNRRLPPPRAAAPLALARIGKPVRASAAELDVNPRARSAIMRTAERAHAA